jgi:hypothetical protein
MGQIAGSGFNATAAMFALWLGVMGVIAVYPECTAARAALDGQNDDRHAVTKVLPSQAAGR